MNRSVISLLAIVATSVGLNALSAPVFSQQSPSEPPPGPGPSGPPPGPGPAGPSSQQAPPPGPSEPSPQPTASPSSPRQPAPKPSTSSSPSSTQPKVINSVYYRCDGGKGFKAVFLSNETVKTTFGSKVLVLPQVESGSGIRYSDGSVTLVGKGNEASVEVGDRVVFNNCVASKSVRALW